MVSKTDSFGFNETKMFQVARDCSPDDHKHTQNLVESKDDMLYVWNAKNCCILVLNWRAAASRKQDELKHQVKYNAQAIKSTASRACPNLTNGPCSQRTTRMQGFSANLTDNDGCTVSAELA